MKVLIVAESEFIIDDFSEYYTKKGYDIIKYRWLMKALDNVEEIEPDIIVLSAIDYPRHWKTFVQFVNTSVCTSNPQIVLVVPQNISAEDKQKAQVLGVKNIVENVKNLNITDVQQNNSKTESTNKTQETTSINDAIDVKPTEQSIKGIDFIFSLPHSKSIITGKVIKYDYPLLHFIPNNKNVLKVLKPEQIINCATLKSKKGVESLTCKIKNITNLLEIYIME